MVRFTSLPLAVVALSELANLSVSSPLALSVIHFWILQVSTCWIIAFYAAARFLRNTPEFVIVVSKDASRGIKPATHAGADAILSVEVFASTGLASVSTVDSSTKADSKNSDVRRDGISQTLCGILIALVWVAAGSDSRLIYLFLEPLSKLGAARRVYESSSTSWFMALSQHPTMPHSHTSQLFPGLSSELEAATHDPGDHYDVSHNEDRQSIKLNQNILLNFSGLNPWSCPLIRNLNTF